MPNPEDTSRIRRTREGVRKEAYVHHPSVLALRGHLCPPPLSLPSLLHVRPLVAPSAPSLSPFQPNPNLPRPANPLFPRRPPFGGLTWYTDLTVSMGIIAAQLAMPAKPPAQNVQNTPGSFSPGSSTPDVSAGHGQTRWQGLQMSIPREHVAQEDRALSVLGTRVERTSEDGLW